MSDSDSFGARSTLEAGGESYEIFRLDALQEKFDVARLPYSLKVLLENLIRNGEDEGAEAVARWSAQSRRLDGLPVKPWLTTTPTGPPSAVNGSALGRGATGHPPLMGLGRPLCLPDRPAGEEVGSAAWAD